MSITREECEKQILEKCKEISDILKEYDPYADYLSIHITPNDEYISVNNNHWEGHPTIAFHQYEGEVESRAY